jgi:hypothetical protein
MAFAFGARTGVFTMRMPSTRKISSKEPLYLLSRSRIRKGTAVIEELEAEVAGLLSDPDAGWIGGAAGEPNAPTAMADEEER